MYKPGTILVLKEQRRPETRTNREGKVILDEKDKPIKFEFPYNRVEVVGESPIDHGILQAGWEGAGARGVIIKPLTEFAGNLDEPYGKLQALYNVESIPEDVGPVAPTIRVTMPGELGPTPEEVFAQEAPGTPPEPGQQRGRTSPLGETKDVMPDPSPLGKADAPVKDEAPTSKSPL
jgi:hypothetical protein